MAISPYDEVGAMGGLFAPSFIYGDPVSEAAVARWNAAHLKRRPAADPLQVPNPIAAPAPAAPMRDAIAQAMLPTSNPSNQGGGLGTGGEIGGDPTSPGSPTAPPVSFAPPDDTTAPPTQKGEPATPPTKGEPAATPPDTSMTPEAQKGFPVGVVESKDMPDVNNPLGLPYDQPQPPQPSVMVNTPYEGAKQTPTISITPTDPPKGYTPQEKAIDDMINPTPTPTPTPNPLGKDQSQVTAPNSPAPPAPPAPPMSPDAQKADDALGFAISQAMADMADAQTSAAAQANAPALGTPGGTVSATPSGPGPIGQQGFFSNMEFDAPAPPGVTFGPMTSPPATSSPPMSAISIATMLGQMFGTPEAAPDDEAAAALAGVQGLSPAENAPGTISATSTPGEVSSFGDSLAGAIAGQAEAASAPDGGYGPSEGPTGGSTSEGASVSGPGEGEGGGNAGGPGPGSSGTGGGVAGTGGNEGAAAAGVGDW